ncbi:MAG: hypothetical protein U0470_11330 [Anaerolineae bacterium]
MPSIVIAAGFPGTSSESRTTGRSGSDTSTTHSRPRELVGGQSAGAFASRAARDPPPTITSVPAAAIERISSPPSNARRPTTAGTAGSWASMTTISLSCRSGAFRTATHRVSATTRWLPTARTPTGVQP